MIRRNTYEGKCCVCGDRVAPQAGRLYSQNDAVIEALRRGELKWLTVCGSERCFATFHGRTAVVCDARPALLADGTVVCAETEASLPFLRAMATLDLEGGRSRWRVLRNPGDRAHVLAVAEKLGLAVDPMWHDAVLPPSVDAMLERARQLGAWQYQIEGIRWLATRASDDTMRGCLLADEPSLGKTIQTLLSLGADEALVVVCPKSALGVWPQEIAKWCPGRLDSVRVAESRSFAWPKSTRECVLVTYDQLPYTKAMITNERVKLLGDRDGVPPNPTGKTQAEKNGRAGLAPQRAVVKAELEKTISEADRAKLETLRDEVEGKLRRNEQALARNAALRVPKKPAVPVVLVLDEVHRAANAKAKRTKGVRGLTPHAKRVVGLTGTPVEDDPFLLASLLTTCCCNPFDRDLLLWGFHAKKLPHGGYEHEREPSTTPGAKGQIKVRPGIPELLRRVMLRRLKAKVLDQLPPKVFSELPIEIDAKVLARLDEIAEDPEVKRLIAEGELPPFGKIAEVRTALARMLVPHTLEIADEYEQQRTPLVVFAEHVEPIEALRNRDGWAVIASGSATISGKSCTHAEAVAAFQSGDGGCIGFAGTIASAGDAITLTRASRMHFVDLAYSHRLNAQAFERCHRPGQQSCVHISTFVPDHPIVRHVAAVLSRKAGFASTVLDSQSEVGNETPSRSAALSSDLDADASERRAVARARVLRLALAAADPSAAATIERDAEAALRRGLTPAQASALAGLLPGAAAGRPTALAAALEIVRNV